MRRGRRGFGVGVMAKRWGLRVGVMIESEAVDLVCRDYGYGKY